MKYEWLFCFTKGTAPPPASPGFIRASGTKFVDDKCEVSPVYCGCERVNTTSLQHGLCPASDRSALHTLRLGVWPLVLNAGSCYVRSPSFHGGTMGGISSSRSWGLQLRRMPAWCHVSSFLPRSHYSCMCMHAVVCTSACILSSLSDLFCSLKAFRQNLLSHA